ncbi:unnamed protein product [Miscanthus lutarioriparius]|uniref:Uncharacterized protein n=1 Tax=Miscanthus lutarioriparius TaxID=422564 RepID=A0A811RAB3_9POAL|nr:unnamed protein product [Miscanthus lutarioriparius]
MELHAIESQHMELLRDNIPMVSLAVLCGHGWPIQWASLPRLSKLLSRSREQQTDTVKQNEDTCKQNEDTCKQIISRAEILSDTLSQHQDNRELMNNSAVRKALEALDKTLGEALQLVMDCQEETNVVCLYYKSGDLSKRLIKVEQHISSKNTDAMLAIMGFLLLNQFNQHGAHPQPQQV